MTVSPHGVHVASELGAYAGARLRHRPEVRHPACEQQAYDVYIWARGDADRHGWDEDRISIGGASAGTQAAFAVVQQAIEAGRRLPVSVSSEFGVCNLARPDAQRTSPKRWPVVPPWLMQLIRDT